MGLLTLPAGIDLHVHFREPGFEYKESMQSGINAARAGGIGTVIDMPNTSPSTDTPKAFQDKSKIASNYPGIFLAAGMTDLSVTKGYLDPLSQLTPLFKVYLAESTGNMQISSENFILGLKELNKSPCLLMLHAEKSELIHPRSSSSLELDVRPREAEIESIKSIIELAPNYENITFHITHVSTGEGSLLLADQSDISWDVLAKYICFNQEEVKNRGNFAKMNPPLRLNEDVEVLLELMHEDKIPIITSDHAPHTIEEKLQNDNIIAGAPGVQETYMVLVDLFLSGKITRSTMINMIHERPKQLLHKFGLEPVKGSLKIDPSKKYILSKGDIKSNCGWSLWENYEFQGSIIDCVFD